MNSASNSATIFSRSLCGMVRSSRAPSISAFSSSCLKNFRSRLADGLPIATRIAAAFCGRVRLSAVLMRAAPVMLARYGSGMHQAGFAAVMISVSRMPKRDGSLFEHGDLAARDAGGR